VSRNERMNLILGLVAKRGSLDVQEASDELKVSLATIRRDFDALAAKQLLNRTHGGVQATGASYDLPLRYKTAKGATGKLGIAKTAASLVKRGDVVALNGGTTTTEIARALAASPHLANNDGKVALTIVTNAINIATELVVHPQIKVVVTGGVARPKSYELIGDYAAGLLEGLVFDIAFVGVNAVDPKVGATANHEAEAKINQLLAESAGKVYVVTIAEKIGERAFARIIKPHQINAILTDGPLSVELQTGFSNEGVEVIVCR
jgi:DeoR family transcriptional regulator of aga operon